MSAAIAGYWSSAGPAKRPDGAAPVGLFADPMVVDFGPLTGTGPQAGRVTLTNRFPVEVLVAHVATSCTCANTRLSRDRLPPGESCELTLEWNPGAKAGVVSETAVVMYQLAGDPRTRGVELRLTGRVADAGGGK
jgi:hypothetical protein